MSEAVICYFYDTEYDMLHQQSIFTYCDTGLLYFEEVIRPSKP